MASWHKIKYDYFNFTVSDKIGIIVLLSLILMLNLISFFLPMILSFEEVDHSDFDEFVLQYESNVAEQKNLQYNSVDEFYPGDIDTDRLEQDFKQGELFEFDPNVVSERELDLLGFTKYQRNNLLKYRNCGGRFYEPCDILKIYGIDSVLYIRLSAYVKIGKKYLKEPRRQVNQPLLFININQADSATLTRLSGIGPILARRICRYRNLLGGYVEKEQFREVYGLSDEVYYNIEDKLRVDSVAIRTIRINYADYSEMVRHPYIDKLLATSLIRIRNELGPLSANLLEECDKIDSMKVSRLKGYLRFD